MNRSRRQPWARTRLAAEILGQGALLLLLIITAYAYVLIADALINGGYTDEERCFQTAVAETDYCRTQPFWR